MFSLRKNLCYGSVLIVTALLLVAGCDNPTTSEASSYTVAFDSQGAGDVVSQTVDNGGKAARPSPNPAKTGHNFDGWYLSPEGGEAWDFAAGTVARDITLYAQWTAIEYRVRFDSRNGSAVDDQTVPYGGRITEPAAPVNGSLILEGWYRESAYATKWDFDVDTVTGAMTLYARWVTVPPGHFLVSFNSRSGSLVESQFVTANGKVVEPDAPTRNNYVFDGWHKDQAAQTAWNFATDTVTATTTLYAAWIPVWTVTFNAQQGSAVDPLTGVLNGATITKPEEDPARPGFSFVGWHKESAGTNVWNFDTDTVTANTTLYAKWTAVYTVTFITGDGSTVAPIEGVLSGALITEPTAPTLSGSNFEGWYKEASYASKWDFATDTVTAATALYARWTVTVTFNANGGSGAPANLTLTRGGVLTQPEAEPVNTGKSFLGWHKEAAGTTAWDYADPVNVHTILYAKWDFIKVDDITNGPTDGIVGEALNIDTASVAPANASFKTIVWTVKTAGAGLAATAVAPFIPTATGSVTLTATITGGLASGNYAKDFPVTVATIWPVTGLTGLSSLAGLTKGYVLDLNAARAAPSNATNKTIVWTVKTAGAGISAAPGTEITAINPDKRLVLTEAGTLELTATIVDGREDSPGALSNYTDDFSFTVDNTNAPPGDVSFGDDTFIKLYANGDMTEPLAEGGTFTVNKDTEYYVTIDGGYSNVVWYLNGVLRPVSGGKLILDTANTGTVTLTVEAEKGGETHDGVYTFIIK
jgi:uncharacterized repeat protein (TIGR02543 family)